ncbi:MAG: hypothetical protein KCHDKBKB_00622 [Elusimicrobia bacterium]|nr:hypothetical protein [Elusimicrobiota bacterium]
MVNHDGGTNNNLLSLYGIDASAKVKIQQIILDNHKTISWNKLYSQNHWIYRKKLAEEIHTLIWIATKQQKIKPVKTCSIVLEAYKTRTIDPDNICAKLYIDGLKESKIIIDDTPQYIYSVVTKSIKAKEDCLKIVIVEPI